MATIPDRHGPVDGFSEFPGHKAGPDAAPVTSARLPARFRISISAPPAMFCQSERVAEDVPNRATRGQMIAIGLHRGRHPTDTVVAWDFSCSTAPHGRLPLSPGMLATA